MERVWSRFESWLDQNTSELADLLNPPATTEEIELTESAIGLRFPPSLRRSYLCHDGESADSGGLFELWRFLPLNEVVEWWTELKDSQTGDPGDFDYMSCIPVFWFEGDVYYVKASRSGEETELASWFHDGLPGKVIGGSFGGFVSTFVESVERGGYQQDEGGMLALERVPDGA